MASTSEIVRIFGDPKEDAKEIYNEFMKILSEDNSIIRDNFLLVKITAYKEQIQLGVFRDMKELAFTLFYEAIKKNALSLCSIMLSNLPELLNTRDEGGNGPQHIYADYYERIQPAKMLFNLLFNEKTDLTPNKKGANPIHIAAAKIGGPAMIFADRFIKKFESTRLFDTWFIAQENDRGFTPLMYRVIPQVRSVVAFDNIPGIYEQHVIKNIKSNYGRNIFHLACIAMMDNVVSKCMTFCMSSKTHPQNDKDKEGKRPMDYAPPDMRPLTRCIYTYISEENARKISRQDVTARIAYLRMNSNDDDKDDLKSVMDSYEGLYRFQVKYPFFFDIVSNKSLLDVWLSSHKDAFFIETLNRSWKIRVVSPGKKVTNTTAIHALIRSKNWKMLNYIATLVQYKNSGKINLNVTNSSGRTPLTYMENLAFLNNCYDKYLLAYTRPNVAITDDQGNDVLSYFDNVAVKQILKQRFGRSDDAQKDLDKTMMKVLHVPELLEEVLKSGANPSYSGNEAMAKCATLGHVQQMKSLISFGAQANGFHQFLTPLGHAIRNKQVETVKWLLSLDVNVNLLNEMKQSAFREVVINTHPTPSHEVVEDEIMDAFGQWEERNSEKIDIFTKDVHGNSIYMEALEEIDNQEAKGVTFEGRMRYSYLGMYIARRKHLLCSSYNAKRWEAINTAIRRDEWTEEVEATILPSYKLNYPPPQVSSRKTLLELAIMAKNYKVVERMVKHLDLDIVGSNPLQNDYDNPYKLSEILLEQSYDTSLDRINGLLQHFRAIKVNEKNWMDLDNDGKVRLMKNWNKAVGDMNEYRILDLFEKGARIKENVTLRKGNKSYSGPPLHICLLQAPLTTPQRQCLKRLVDFGADVNAFMFNDTPLMTAIKTNAVNCIHILAGFPVAFNSMPAFEVEKPKLDVNLQSKFNGVTALMMAAEKGNEKLLDAIIRLNPDPNIVNNNGETALAYCSEEVDYAFDTLIAMPTFKIQAHKEALITFMLHGNTKRVLKMIQLGAMLPDVPKEMLRPSMLNLIKRMQEAMEAQDKDRKTYLKALATNRLFAQIKSIFGERVIEYNSQVNMMGEDLLVWAYQQQFYLLVNYMLDILQRKCPELMNNLSDYLDVGTGEIIRINQAVRLQYRARDGSIELSFKRYERNTAIQLGRAQRRTSEGRIPIGFVNDNEFNEKVVNYLRTISTAAGECMKSKKSSSSSNDNNSPEALLAYGKKIIDTAGNNWEKRLEEFVKENPGLSNALKQYAMRKMNRAAIRAISKAKPFLDVKLKF